MIYMFEELEKLAVELGQALPKIVVTCSAESLSMKRMKRDAAALNSSSHLPPPPPGPTVGNESLVGYDAGTGLSLAPSTVAFSSSSEKSLTCIYLPQVSRLQLELFSQHFPSAYNHLVSVETELFRARYHARNLRRMCHMYAGSHDVLTIPDLLRQYRKVIDDGKKTFAKLLIELRKTQEAFSVANEGGREQIHTVITEGSPTTERGRQMHGEFRTQPCVSDVTSRVFSLRSSPPKVTPPIRRDVQASEYPFGSQVGPALSHVPTGTTRREKECSLGPCGSWKGHEGGSNRGSGSKVKALSGPK
jgi:hypothetical protein